MAEYVDRDIQIPVPCPDCGITYQISLRSLERCDAQYCVSCGSRFRIQDPAFHRKLQEGDAMIEEMLTQLVELVAESQGRDSLEPSSSTPDNLVV